MDLYGDLPPPSCDGGGNKGTSSSSGNTSLLSSAKLASSSPSSQPNMPLKTAPLNAGKVKPAGFSMAFKPRQTAISRETPSTVKKSIPLPSNSSIPLIDVSISNRLPLSSMPTELPAALALPPTNAQPEMGFFDVEDPYDPSRPNDYIQMCEERQEKKRLRRMEEENYRILQQREQERLRVEAERAEALQKGDFSRVEASLAGPRRGVSNLPSWMTNK